MNHLLRSLACILLLNVGAATAQHPALSARMKYEAGVVHGQGADSLYHYYFHEHRGGSEYPCVPYANRYWEIDRAPGSADTVILQGNPWPCEWRIDPHTPLCIGVNVQVAKVNAASAQSVLRVVVTHVRIEDGSRTSTAFDVPSNLFTRANADTVLFSPPFHLSHPFLYGRDSLLVAVHSPRAVTARLAWVILEDTLARDMTTCYDLSLRDPSIHEWMARHNRIVTSILEGSVSDIPLSEPFAVSQLCSHAEVQAIMRYREKRSASRGGR